MNILEKRVFEMYKKTGKSKNCILCKKIGGNKLAGPISFFHIGSNFEKDEYRIVFVGKNSWYDKKDFKEDKITNGYFADVTETGRKSLEGELNKRSHYWKRIRDIIENLYGRFYIENFAVTNLIRCNTSGEENNSSDITPKEIKENCMNYGIFEKEIGVLKPRHIIFFTGKDYDNFIKKIDFGCDKNEIKNIKNHNKGKIILWERNFYNKNRKLKIRFLRTGHPQGKPKEKFVKNIVDWIKNS